MKSARALGLLMTLSVLTTRASAAQPELEPPPGVESASATEEVQAAAEPKDVAAALQTHAKKAGSGTPTAPAVPPEVDVFLSLLLNLIFIAIGISGIGVLLSVLALLPRWRRRGPREATQEKAIENHLASPKSRQTQPESGVDETSSAPPDPGIGGGTLTTRRDHLTGAPAERPAALGRQLPPETPDEFMGLPHEATGRALRRLHQALPGLACKIPDPRQQARFLAELDLPIQARVKRFKEATLRGDAFLKEHWVEQDLVTTLNSLAQALSSVIEERYRGRRGNRDLEEELSGWLYEQLAPVCQAEGWFRVESILPFTTRFDPRIHHSLGSVELAGSGNLIVAIKAIGRRDARQGFVTHKAEVLVGR